MQLVPKGTDNGQSGWKRLPAFVLLLLIFSASPQLLFAEVKTGQGSFLSLTDLHFDPFADPALVNRLESADYREWEKIFESSKLGGIGSYGKDTPYPLVKSTFDAMRRVAPAPEIILFSGDFLAHDFREQFDKLARDKSDAAYRRFVEKTVRFLARMFDARFPSVPVIPALGNNDSFCGDYGVAPGGEFLKMFAGVWATLAARGEKPVSFLETFSVGGYYGIANPALKGHRIVVLNANLFSRKAVYCTSDSEDHGGQELSWLDWTLYQARLNGDKVWVLYHEPPGVDIYASLHGAGDCRGNIKMMLKDGYNTGLLRLLEKYAPIVEASFSGHTHMDEFRLINKDGIPLLFSHMTPSVSPVFGNNPAFQLFAFNRDSGLITDYATYILGNFPKARTTDDARWEMEYDYGKAFGQHEYTPAALHMLYRDLEKERAIRHKYMDYYASGTGKVVSDDNWRAFWCGIGNAEKNSFAACFCDE